MSARWLASVCALALAGCPSSDNAPPDGGALACGPGVEQRPIAGYNHVAAGTTVSYPDNPPSSGDHWPFWADWGVSATPIPVEEWVHNLEHGGIVLLYNCPSGCADDEAALAHIYQTTPTDQFHEVRILVTAYGPMPHKLAAVAWGWRWQGDAVDEKTLRCFIAARYDMGRESIP